MASATMLRVRGLSTRDTVEGWTSSRRATSRKVTLVRFIVDTAASSAPMPGPFRSPDQRQIVQMANLTRNLAPNYPMEATLQTFANIQQSRAERR
jgi:hypothetical protein